MHIQYLHMSHKSIISIYAYHNISYHIHLGPVSALALTQRGDFRKAFCVFNVQETVDSLGGTGVDIDGVVPQAKVVIFCSDIHVLSCVSLIPYVYIYIIYIYICVCVCVLIYDQIIYVRTVYLYR